jgi:hypothetical protein
MTESDDSDDQIDYEVIRNQRFMIATAREFLRDVEPWKTGIDEVGDETCITLEEFNKWRKHLLKILGIAIDG